MHESSNSGSKVNWGAGSKDVFVTQPAEKAVHATSTGTNYFQVTQTTPTDGSGFPVGYIWFVTS